MACHFICLAGVRKASARPGALALAVLMGLVGLPEVSRAECVQQMSRMPMAGPSGGGAPTYRANMMRRAPAARPATTTARPRLVKAKASGQVVRKARPVRKASLNRPARRKAPRVQRAAAGPAPTIARVYPAPTPMPVAARELAVPRAYALIATTVCETGPAVLGAPGAGVPVLAIAPGPGGGPSDGFIPGGDTGTFLPPTLSPGGPGGGGPGTPPIVGPGGEPPLVQPAFVEPPLTEPPPTEPPITEPPLVEPPLVEPPFTEPPIGPPGEPPPVPPIFPPPPGPPVIEPPPVIPVPEPGTWALMIIGFGLIGARLRATSAASGSRGRVRQRG